MTNMRLSLIAAADKGLGIGKNGTLPWRLKKEMNYFSNMTRHVNNPEKRNAIIMGRRTWESLPAKHRPMPDRLNIILSKSIREVPEGVYSFHTLDEALDDLKNNHSDIERIWIIGGAGVYKEAMDHRNGYRVYLTELDAEYDCDTFFPSIPDSFKMLKDHGDESDLVPLEQQEENGIKYYFRIYEKTESV